MVYKSLPSPTSRHQMVSDTEESAVLSDKLERNLVSQEYHLYTGLQLMIQQFWMIWKLVATKRGVFLARERATNFDFATVAAVLWQQTGIRDALIRLSFLPIKEYQSNFADQMCSGGCNQPKDWTSNNLKRSTIGGVESENYQTSASILKTDILGMSTQMLAQNMCEQKSCSLSI